MADGGDDRQVGGGNGFGEEFAIEGCQVFERSPAARDDDDVNQAGAVEMRDAGGDFGCGCFSLNDGGIEEDMEAGVAAADDIEEVADDSAGGRGDDADAVRKGRQRLLASRIEEAARFQPLLELFKGDLQRAGTDGLEEFGNELHLAALFVDGNFAAEQDVEAVGGFETQERGLLAKEHGGQLRFAILECEVDVAGGGGAEVGDFAFDPEVAVLALDVEAYFADQLADVPDAARGRRRGGLKGETELAFGLGCSTHRGWLQG